MLTFVHCLFHRRAGPVYARAVRLEVYFVVEFSLGPTMKQFFFLCEGGGEGFCFGTLGDRMYFPHRCFVLRAAHQMTMLPLRVDEAAAAATAAASEA